jgi:folate-binding protein YgfZ
VHWSREGTEGVPDPRLPALGRRWLAPAGRTGGPAGSSHRLLARGHRRPRPSSAQDKTLWLECNAAELNGVSFTKGCYVGQENTARMNYRSKVNRRLVVVPVEAPGANAAASFYPDLGHRPSFIARSR